MRSYAIVIILLWISLHKWHALLAVQTFPLDLFHKLGIGVFWPSSFKLKIIIIPSNTVVITMDIYLL